MLDALTVARLSMDGVLTATRNLVDERGRLFRGRVRPAAPVLVNLACAHHPVRSPGKAAQIDLASGWRGFVDGQGHHFVGGEWHRPARLLNE
jgi:hypothetical protein